MLSLDGEHWTSDRISAILDLAARIKAEPAEFRQAMAGKTLLMLFEKPSLRTRVSFETGMTQMGGHGIFYSIADGPLGEKETFGDTGAVLSRYVDVVMARLYEHDHLLELAAHSSIPLINGLTNFSHPCQILADLLSIREKKGDLASLKLAYLGDANNNVTHSLLFGCARMGLSISVGCPSDPLFCPEPQVLATAREFAGDNSAVEVLHAASEAVSEADVIYTDSWMSYHVSAESRAARVESLSPFQVTAALMAQAKPDALFMNCLPAKRGEEQTAEVIDGPQSIVFDQAENRLHVQKAIILDLVERAN